MPASKSTQLPLDLPHREALAREDFLVSSSNEQAVAHVDSWPDWPHPALVIVGPPGSGKSHLAAVWRAVSGARVVQARELTQQHVPGLLETGACLVEDAPSGSLDETALFHLFNLARENGASLLLTSRQWPSRWRVDLPDLVSRLKAAQTVTLGEPDDALLRGVLVKLFEDRQLAVDETIISYMTTRMERSLDAARKLVADIDAAALAARAEISRHLVARVMHDSAPHDPDATN